MPPESSSGVWPELVRQMEQLQRLADAPLRDLPGDVEVPGMGRKVLVHRQLGVEAIGLRYHAQYPLDLPLLPPDVPSLDQQLAPVHGGDARDHLHRARLAGAVGPQEAEALAPSDGEADPVHGDEIPVPLGQVVRDY